MRPVERASAVVPAGLLVLFTLMDIAMGPQGVLLGLVVIAPLTAASLLSRRSTVSFAVLALVVAAALGVYDQQLTVDSARATARARDAEGMAGLGQWLQHSLLTKLQPVPEVEVAARYQPAADHVKIGGDWHDAFRTPGDRTNVHSAGSTLCPQRPPLDHLKSTQRRTITRWSSHVRDRHAAKITICGWSIGLPGSEQMTADASRVDVLSPAG